LRGYELNYYLLRFQFGYRLATASWQPVIIFAPFEPAMAAGLIGIKFNIDSADIVNMPFDRIGNIVTPVFNTFIGGLGIFMKPALDTAQVLRYNYHTVI
jgi:hypothetical protein